MADQDADGIPDCCDAGRSCPEFLDVPAEYPTIQSALDACPENGVIRLSPGEYSEALEIPARNITIQGDPEYPTTRQILGCCGTSAVNADGPFDGTLTLKGLSIVGSEGYGVRVDRMGVQIIDCIISGSHASGVILLNEARGDFVRTTFANNSGRGAYAYVASHINADDCDFSGNITASYGAGIGFHVGSSGFIRDCRFGNNLSTSGQGNDVGLSFGGSRVFERCTFVRGEGVSGPLWWTEFGGSGSSADGVFCGSLPSDISGGFTDAGGNEFFGTGCAARCVGDLTEDGQVGPADLGLLLAYYRNYEEFPSGDLNNDQEIDAADLGLLIAAWGSCH